MNDQPTSDRRVISVDPGVAAQPGVARMLARAHTAGRDHVKVKAAIAQRVPRLLNLRQAGPLVIARQFDAITQVAVAPVRVES